MAPEVIGGQGYTFIVDFWSIAICMYEFICGGVPFGENCDDPMDVYMAVMNEELKFPSFVDDNVFKSLIKDMIKKNQVTRTCNLGHVKKHPYFFNFDWVKKN
jgi:cGMP-dependent protein kinase